MAYSHVGHGSFIWVTWLIHICNMTHSYVRRGASLCVTWLIHVCNSFTRCTCEWVMSHVRHNSFIRARVTWTWLIHMCDIIHPHERHDSFTCVTWPIHTCNMTRHMCNMTHLCVHQDSLRGTRQWGFDEVGYLVETHCYDPAHAQVAWRERYSLQGVIV